MLWGPPGFVEHAMRKKARSAWAPAARKALRRFKAELKQRRQQLAAAINAAACKLAVRADREHDGDAVLAIGAPDILEFVRLTIPDVTLTEVNETIMQTLPYMGGG
jgi:hypothetical protein